MLDKVLLDGVETPLPKGYSVDEVSDPNMVYLMKGREAVAVWPSTRNSPTGGEIYRAALRYLRIIE